MPPDPSAPGSAGPGPADKPQDRLDRYRQKRVRTRTPEPFGGDDPGPHRRGGDSAGTPRLFVFHKHHASTLHWDLRLELDGALESWAVPKGPHPSVKRLAMRVEPHPLDYADFEGVIPAGEYGGGPSIVWDRGVWIALDDPRAGLAKGRLSFELRGYKVRGRWKLVRTSDEKDQWLLIRTSEGAPSEGAPSGDAMAATESAGAYPEASIYSGLDVDELPEAAEHAARLRARALELGAVERPVGARDVQAMTATRREHAFDDAGWVFEIKYDGYRLLAGREPDGSAALMSRSGQDLTAAFPEIARAVEGLPYEGVVLDGEVVVHDERGLPDFGLLQKRGRLRDRRDIARATLDLPATCYAFDLLAVGGLDCRDLPLLERKELLERVVPPAGPIRYSEHIPGKGRAMFEQVTRMGLEGVVAKRADSRYRGGRSRDWYKIRTVRTDDFVVVGWSDPSGRRAGFGSLHVAQYDGSDLVFRGSVGTGYTQDRIRELVPRLKALGEGTPPPVRPSPGGELPRGREHHWIAPELVIEVQYREITAAGVLRHPSFLRVRADKPPAECRMEGGIPDPPEPDGVVGGVEVDFTNPDKVFWPEDGYTKGDLIEYHRTAWEWIEPYLADRPVVLTRYPDGIEGKSFYQKDAPDWVPDWIRTVRLPSGSEGDTIDYFVADRPESLLYLVNLGTIPLHIWHSRVAALDRPDWCLLDLDPKDAPFEHVVEIARFLHGLCDDIGLPNHVKTSGASGLHVMIPLGGQVGYEESRRLGELLARLAVAELPEVATVERSLKKRQGRVYVDFLQNARGQLVAAPYCVRSRPGAPVSTPLRWKDVRPSLDPRKYTIQSVPRRMRALKDGDPLRPVLTEAPDLLEALERLGERQG